LKAVHIECGNEWYGGPVQVVYLMRGLRERGHESILLCPTGAAIAEKGRDLGLRVVTFAYRGDPDPRLIGAAFSLIRRERPDIVHLHSRRGADTLGGLAAWLARAPAIVLTRRIDDPPHWWLALRMRYGLIYHGIVAISDAIRRVLTKSGVPTERITVVRSAIDAGPYRLESTRDSLLSELGLDRSARIVGMVSQFIERKGHRHLLAAAPRIIERFPKAVFMLCGKGPLEAWVASEVRRLALGNHVIFAGFRDDIPRILAGLDLLVHPPDREGLGVAVLQAQAAGLPVVATRAGGIPEIIRDGESGLLVEPGDSGALAEAICTVLGDPDLARRMGECGRAVVEHEFSVDAMVEGNLKVYSELLAGSA
jgi:glycosyltransferase involved in cell wall biosynthesis